MKRSYFLHLALVLILKVLFLIAIWHVFIKPNKLYVDSDVMSNRMTNVGNIKEHTRD